MDFQKYIHLERFGTDEVDGINIGECHVFPKIDGTNASVWWGGDRLLCGSRNRLLSLDNDNAGFMAWAIQQPHIAELCRERPHLILYGEWLVPHSLNTYRDDAWRQFYVFDVYDRSREEFVHYDVYSQLLSQRGIQFIPCSLKTRNPTYELLLDATQKNTYLLQEGKGAGEGVVIKQYGWKNRFGRTVWAKLITNTFRDKHVEVMGGAVINLKLLEEQIAEEFLTEHTVEKIIAKIRLSKVSPDAVLAGGVAEASFAARDIPQLLGMAYHDLVSEEIWEIVKKHKNPKIDFKTLNHCAIARVKQLKPELFGVRAG